MILMMGRRSGKSLDKLLQSFLPCWLSARICIEHVTEVGDKSLEQHWWILSLFPMLSLKLGHYQLQESGLTDHLGAMASDCRISLRRVLSNDSSGGYLSTHHSQFLLFSNPMPNTTAMTYFTAPVSSLSFERRDLF